MTGAKKRYQQKVEKTYIDLYPTDEDIKSRFVERQTQGEGKATYIKRLIREDIKKELVERQAKESETFD